MGIITKAITKSVNEFPSIDTQGWHQVGVGIGTTYEHYRNNDYENAYPSITKIVNRFMKIAPYAIDQTKETVDNARAVEKLYHPNQQMSSVDFREALAVMYLVHPKTHVLVWRLEGGVAIPGGDLTPDNIAGYTFLEDAVETTVGGKTTYTVNGQTYTDREVITLKGMFPYNLSRGYSPTEAARRWSRIDDYIADYQQGFFKNGAIPSGMFKITASTVAEYNDVVDMMQKRHRGAGKNNNVTYAHVPIDPNSGKPAEAQIEWIPFNVDNKNLDLKNIFEQVNQKLDSAFGVPASIRGVGENNNYATAQMDNRNFVENVIDPLALKIWTRFTHELNRITGGLGYAITYDLDLPSVSEDEKVQAETSKILVDAVVTAVAAGFSVDSVVGAIEAPESFQSLVDGYTPPETKDDMDVDTGDEVEDSPDQPVIGDVNKAVSAREYSDLLEKIVPKETGYIMLNTEKIKVMQLVEGAENDLVPEELTDFGNLPAETVPHLTLLDGVLAEPNSIRELSERLYKATPLKSVEIEGIDYFDLENSNAIIAKIKATDELAELRENFDLIPHASKFSTYNPHITLAYLSKDASVDKWVKTLTKELPGKTVKIKGLNLGDTKEAAKSTNPKAKKLSPEQEAITEQKLYTVAKRFMESQVQSAINDTKAIGDPTEEQLATFTDEALNIISTLLVSQGAIEQALGLQLLQNAGIDTPSVTPFKLSQSQIQRYRSYLTNVGRSYSSDTATAIRSVLDRANLEGFTNQQIQSALRDVVKLDDYRVVRLARTETVRAGGNASLLSMEQIQSETEVQLRKVWNVNAADPCPYCQALNGTSIGISEPFVPLGGTIVGEDGSIMVNNFVSMEIASAHPNCRCSMVYEVVR